MIYKYKYDDFEHSVIGNYLEQAKLNALVESFYRSYPALNDRIQHGYNYVEKSDKILSEKILNRLLILVFI